MSYTNSLSKTVLSVKPLFKRFQRFEKPLYDMKIFESELVLGVTLMEFPHRKNEPQSCAKFPQSCAKFQNISLRNFAPYFAKLCG
ncbi:MAG: hypothetical protein BWK80_25075 [Desulfobacteraceae bacterium IS3]|nr:MAG: hypothetical protein BWK80_25075 [Desulfobacteraceae bacterium IS3]